MSRNTLLSNVLFVAATILIPIGSAPGAPGGGALKPDQVLVVANADSEPSRNLAAFYASQREIPKRNIVLVKTPSTYLISSEAYQSALRRPIMQAMLERRLDSHIRCICVIWGVPVRISEAGGKPEAKVSSTEEIYKTRAREALTKMAVYHKLLNQVGQAPAKLPPVPENRLENVADLFNSPLPAPPDQIPKAEELFKLIRRSIVRRQIKVRFMGDKSKKALAERQLMALHREMYGLQGLINFIRDARLTKPPDTAVLRSMLKKVETSLRGIRRTGQTLSPETAGIKADLLRRSGGLRLVVGLHAGGDSSSKKTPSRRSKANRLLSKTTASVDSELALLWGGNYKLQGAVGNPLYWRYRVRVSRSGRRPACLMTARIDAPSVSIARKMIADSIAVEKVGLKGVFYIDSGLTKRFAASTGTGYRAYDNRLVRLKEFVAKRTNLKVVLETSSGLFAPGKCPDAALYAGWYSLRRYIPAFTWVRGSVGWHTASFEAADLRNPKSQQWCPQMLSNGVSGTLGAVDEPFLDAFPAPDEFYPLLLTGKYSIAECYWRTTPKVSWQMTLIADPLYNPFKNNPKATTSALPIGLAPR